MDEKRLVDGATALAEKQPRVIKIEPTERPQNVRLRVAAYTRVSSDSEDQLNSFAAQNRYYTELISSKAEWRMVDIYADEGITGTSVAKRDDFQRMMADCRRGLIDQILVKSISRFARNTKDCLQNIRELKELGVNVRFEREGIDTINVSSELITAIYAAFAQKESESISGNMRWSYQRRMKSGEFNTCKAPWGFRLDGRKLKVYEPEADIVQRIFHEYLSGKNPQEIADDLNASCLTERVWNYKAVDYILQNERYAGNALLQKRYASFCRLYYKLKHQSIPILEQMLTNLQLIRNRRMLWSPDIVALNKRISDLSSQNQTLAFLKQQGLVDPDIFIAKTNELTKQLQQAKLEKEKLMDAESDMTALQTRDLIDILEGGPEFLDSFDAELFGELVEKIIIESNDSVRFCLKNGLELRESIERTVR